MIIILPDTHRQSSMLWGFSKQKIKEVFGMIANLNDCGVAPWKIMLPRLKKFPRNKILCKLRQLFKESVFLEFCNIIRVKCHVYFVEITKVCNLDLLIKSNTFNTRNALG